MQLTLAHGVTMDLVFIPAGEFWMGSDIWKYDEQPKHLVSLPEYWIGKYLVTVAQYAAFGKARDFPIRPAQIENPLVKANYPVGNTSWQDAQAFCRWVGEAILLGVEGVKGWQARLPGEAEWEKAARGTDGREFPWGGEPPDEKRCNFNRDFGNATPVGHYSPSGDSPYGCADMAGNLWEWTHSLYKPYPYLVDDGREAEFERGDRTTRGGAYYSYANFMRCSARSSKNPDQAYLSHGFRLCVSPFYY